MRTRQKTWWFRLEIDGELTDERVDALFEAGCNDALFGSIDNQSYGSFARQAKDWHHAIKSATKQVNNIEGLRVTQVVPEKPLR